MNNNIFTLELIMIVLIEPNMRGVENMQQSWSARNYKKVSLTSEESAL